VGSGPDLYRAMKDKKIITLTGLTGHVAVTAQY